MKILLSCGEPSGDLYAGALTHELRALDSSVRVFGLGGDRLRAAGGDVVEDFRGLTVTGLSEAVSVLPRSLAVLRRLAAVARRERPDVFVPVDFPEINFRLAATARSLGIPVVYYVCPQVWAWRRRRLKTMKRLTTRALVIFPFEERLYRDAQIPVEFVGHPLIDLTHTDQSREQLRHELGLGVDTPTVALLPGSRPNEVRAILSELVGAMGLVARQVPGVQCIVARAPNLDDDLFTPIGDVGHLGLTSPPVVVEARTDDVLSVADVVVTASGTATVQTAIHGRPMVVVYRLSPLTYRMVRAFAHVESVGMVNLIAGERIVSELLQDALTAGAVAAEVVRYFNEPSHATQARAALARVRQQLGTPGASRRAAQAVLAVARGGGSAQT